MRIPYIISTITLGAVLALAGCKGCYKQQEKEATTTPPPVTLNVPRFNPDSAYQGVAAQVAFGPRVPGSPAQQKCAAWMQTMLRRYCDTVYKQETKVKGGDGKMLPCINLIGVINPAATKRILLLTHWDSRSWADMDTKDKDKPILAADDAGSGVGVLIEVARQVKIAHLDPSTGIDILFTDVEDYGKSEWGDDSYCLGTQYWARNPHVPGYRADFGILLDMVGAKEARFPLEQLSTQFAPEVQQMVWAAAGRAGFSSYFSFTQGAAITDDHEYVNKLAHIPTIDIINLTAGIASPFATHWHTHQDNMEIIDKNTLNAVGQTLLQVIFETAQPAS
ncbi:MAG: M28 family peptidase [Bacteroidetes bacterium]|nr:M28 family peptidase [Bacteroidota bacterium]